MMSSQSKRLNITVIIPTYNRAQVLAEAIDSLLAQTHIPEEIIVVDDGSTDETPSLLLSYGSSIEVITQSNQGRSAARNMGLAAAKGDLISFLDSDDLLPPNSIERRAAALQSQPKVGAVYTDVILVDHAGEAIDLFSRVYPISRPSGFIFPELALHNFIVLSSVMFRRFPEKETIRFDEDLEPCEDTDFWLQMSERYQFQYLDEPLVRYRVHPSTQFIPDHWGLPGGSHMTQHQQAKLAELEVQKRVFAMSSFESLTSRQKAKVYCSHGVKLAMAGHLHKARDVFIKSIHEAPSGATGYVLLVLSYLGRRIFEAVIFWRRRLTRRFARSSKSAMK